MEDDSEIVSIYVIEWEAEKEDLEIVADAVNLIEVDKLWVECELPGAVYTEVGVFNCDTLNDITCDAVAVAVNTKVVEYEPKIITDDDGIVDSVIEAEI